VSKKVGEFVPQGLTYIANNITSKGNIIGASKSEKAKWAKDVRFADSKETIFFAGCGYQYSSALESMMGLIRKMDKSVIGSDFAMGAASIFQKRLGIDVGGLTRKISSKDSESEAQPLKDAVKVLQKLGLNIGYLGEEEPCCGGLLYYTGVREEFMNNAQELYKKLKTMGVKKIVSIVPSCTYTLKTLIPECVPGWDIEVKHYSQVVAENIQSKNFKFPKNTKVTYHDPCQLSRYLGLIDEPRKILSSIKGLEFVEPEWTKGEWSTCCGGGGGFEVVFPEISEMLAVARVQELTKTGAQMIVTACPGCIMQIQDGLKAQKIENVEVLDLAEVIAQSMEG
jgi:hypothetical protein